MAQTGKLTDGHGNSMTNQPTGAKSVKIKCDKIKTLILTKVKNINCDKSPCIWGQISENQM